MNNSSDVVCNGKSSSSTVPTTTDKSTKFTTYNMNWFLFTLYARQDFSLCKIFIEHQMKANFDQEYLYFVKGLIARHEAKFSEAIKCFQCAVNMNTKNVENYKEIGKTLFIMGKLKRSLEVFLKAETLLQRPDSEVYHFIGELLTQNIGLPRAGPSQGKEYFHRAIQNGRQIESYKKLANIYVNENDYSKAIEMLENSLSVSQENSELLTEIGILFLKMHDPKNAYEKLTRAVQINGNSTKALIALGAVLQSKNDIDGALNQYKRINDIERNSSELWSNLGLCFFKKQKFIAAISCLKKAVWVSPLNFNVLYNLGLVLLTAQQYTSAFHSFATAINIRPEHAECFMMLGICLKNLNDKENAQVSLERSIMLPGAIKNPLIYLNFSIFCYENGQDAQAKQYLIHFMKMLEHQNVSNQHKIVAEKLKLLLLISESDMQSNKYDEIAAKECQEDIVEKDVEKKEIDSENVTPNEDNDNSI